MYLTTIFCNFEYLYGSDARLTNFLKIGVAGLCTYVGYATKEIDSKNSMKFDALSYQSMLT